MLKKNKPLGSDQSCIHHLNTSDGFKISSNVNSLTSSIAPTHTYSQFPAWSAWLILMGCPLFVNVPSSEHRCRLSIIAGLWGSVSIWHHIWRSAASINAVIFFILFLNFHPSSHCRVYVVSLNCRSDSRCADLIG